MQDELHASALVEETLRDDGLLRRHCAQHRSPFYDVFDQLLRTRIVQTAFGLQPRHRVLHFRARLEPAHWVELAVRPASRPIIFFKGHGYRRAVRGP